MHFSQEGLHKNKMYFSCESNDYLTKKTKTTNSTKISYFQHLIQLLVETRCFYLNSVFVKEKKTNYKAFKELQSFPVYIQTVKSQRKPIPHTQIFFFPLALFNREDLFNLTFNLLISLPFTLRVSVSCAKACPKGQS